MSAAPNYSQEPYPFRDVTEHLKRCFDAYGPQRCYWGTDLTNSLRQGDLQAAHHPFHRGAVVPIRGRQGLGDGQGIMARLKWA